MLPDCRTDWWTMGRYLAVTGQEKKCFDTYICKKLWPGDVLIRDMIMTFQAPIDKASATVR